MVRRADARAKAIRGSGLFSWHDHPDASQIQENPRLHAVSKSFGSASGKSTENQISVVDFAAYLGISSSSLSKIKSRPR